MLAPTQGVNDLWSRKRINEAWVSVKDYGAVGDGTTDDTAAIQTAIDASVGKTLVIPAGTYMIDAVTTFGIVVPSNVIIEFLPGAIFQAITNSANDYRILYLQGVENITIYNPVIYGDKATHTGTTGEGGHGIGIFNSSNVKIYNAICNNCWGCGIGLVYVEDIYIENVVCDNNRQNNIALISGRNVTIKDPICTNASGTLPSGGIDIEPNLSTDYLENINIINPKTSGNDGAGVIVALTNLVNGTNDVSINIENHVDTGSTYGLYVGKLAQGTTGTLKGKIEITKPICMDNLYTGIYINNYASGNTPNVLIDKPTIINPNAANGTTSAIGSGVVFYREVAATETNTMGNLTIINPEIKDVRATKQMLFGIILNDLKGSDFANVIIQDPVAMEGTATSHINYKIWVAQSGVAVRDSYNIVKGTFVSATTLLSRVYTKLDNDGATTLTTFTLNLNAVVIDAPITFTNLTTYGIKIVPESTACIAPLSTTVSKYIQSTVVGSSITIRKKSATMWIIENITGTWTAEE